jgi:oxygen-independent coproporphyrinogen-3 oxidase
MPGDCGRFGGLPDGNVGLIWIWTFCAKMAKISEMNMALYIHFPFCIRKCLYCDFNSQAGSVISPTEYFAALMREMELRMESMGRALTVSTLYLGGGTPSLLDPRLVARLIEAAARLFAVEADAEITIEANPGTVTREKLTAYRLAGVNRLSIGMQSFSDRMLSQLGRVHNAREGLDAFSFARDAGFANIGIDLIHSLPGENLDIWLADLDQAILLLPEHISAYGLTIEAGTPFHAMDQRGDLALPCEETAAVMFEMTSDLLRQAGYEHYEISNYALPGFRSRHNQVYWQRGSYLGLGAGAHSFLASPHASLRWKNPDSPEFYMKILAEGVLPEEELSAVMEREAMGETLFLGLRMLEGVDPEQFREEFGVTLQDVYPAEFQELLADGLLELQKGRVRLSRRGLILANQVFIRFV